jgi:hypothetical protein
VALEPAPGGSRLPKRGKDGIREARSNLGLSHPRMTDPLAGMPEPAPPHATDRPPAAAGPAGVGTPVADPTPETRRLYAADWRAFVAWCRGQRVAALPATAATLAAYLLAAAPGLSRGALGRRRAAIGSLHRQHGLPVPRLDKAARAALRNALRPAPDPPPPSKVLTSATLRRLAAKCPRDPAGLRDRALLLLLADVSVNGRAAPGSAAGDADGPVGQAALLGLDAEHVRFTAEGVTLRLHARSDEIEPSLTRQVARSAGGMAVCPVRALEEWLRGSDTSFGPVFRKVDRWGNVEHARLGLDGVRRIIARRLHPGAAKRPRARVRA